MIKEYPDVKKVLHCFDSSLDFIKQTENLNCIYSFTGLITISDYEKHAENLNYLKWDQIMLETDSPYLIPRENKKPIKVRKLKENGPFLLPYIVNKVAEYKMCTSDTVVSETTKTTKLFSIFVINRISNIKKDFQLSSEFHKNLQLYLNDGYSLNQSLNLIIKGRRINTTKIKSKKCILKLKMVKILSILFLV